MGWEGWSRVFSQEDENESYESWSRSEGNSDGFIDQRSDMRSDIRSDLRSARSDARSDLRSDLRSGQHSDETDQEEPSKPTKPPLHPYATSLTRAVSPPRVTWKMSDSKIENEHVVSLHSNAQSSEDSDEKNDKNDKTVRTNPSDEEASSSQDFHMPKKRWDSDKSFPVMEIERLRNKATKLRNARGEKSTIMDDKDAFSPENFHPFPTRDESPARSVQSARNRASNSGDSRQSDDSLAEVLDVTYASSMKENGNLEKVEAILVKSFDTRGKPRSSKSPERKRRLSRKLRGRSSNARDNAHDSGSRTESSTSDTVEEGPTDAEDSNESEPDPFAGNLTLHDLCGEATTTEDVAWRNALYLLSIHPQLASVTDELGFLPLHICCLGPQPPPFFMVRALLYAEPNATCHMDDGGRLPLHLLAASSGDIEAMQALVEVNPAALCHRDEHGFTPLHLMLRNFSVEVTVKHVRILLGETLHERNVEQASGFFSPKHVLQRRKEHLNLQTHELHRLKRRPAQPTYLHGGELDEVFHGAPPDVQVSVRKLLHWHNRNHKNYKPPKNALSPEDVTPASIPLPDDMTLPVHMALTRGITRQVPLNVSNTFREGFDDEHDDDEISTQRPKPSIIDAFDVLRTIIHAFPEALCFRDADGYTPLLHVMLMNNGLPSRDLVELVLGKRSAMFESLPEWLVDVPLHALSGSRYLSPSMIPSRRNKQLPLHVAAEEFAADVAMVEMIHQSYPAAVNVQDYFGRTPLHLAFSNYRLFPVDSKVLSRLFSTQAARTRDNEGKLPFDLLVENNKNIPRQLPSNPLDYALAEEICATYQKLLAATVQSRTPIEADEGKYFLSQLRQLPTWVREQACSVPYVQQLIIEELSGPWCTAGVLLDGLILVVLMVAFRLQAVEFLGVFSEDAPSDESYTDIIYTTAGSRVIIRGLYYALEYGTNQMEYSIFQNSWSLIDLSAMALAFTTTAALTGGQVEDQAVLSLITATTGALWLSLLGFLSTWFYGMAVLSGALAKIAYLAAWATAGTGAMIVGFAHMFQTALWPDCESALSGTQVCDTRDSYRVVYLLLRGESFLSKDGSSSLSPAAIVMVTLFAVATCILAAAVITTVVISAVNTRIEDVAQKFFWEPKLSFVLVSHDWRNRKFGGLADKWKFSQRMERSWEILWQSLMGYQQHERRNNFWFASRKARSSSCAFPTWILSIVVLPLWFLAGLVTFGILWPPQLRRAIFKPWTQGLQRQQPKSSSPEFVSRQVSDLHSEVLRLKTLSYDRSVHLENEVNDVRDLLHMAMREE